MKEYKRRILSLCAASLMLIGYKSNFKVDAYNEKEDIVSVSEISNNNLINSDNIKKYLYNEYKINDINELILQQITNIELNGFNQSDLEELCMFPNLKNLILRNGTIEDSSFLDNLKKLNMLTIYSCKVNDLSKMKNTNINIFDSGNCYLTNDMLENLPSSLRNLRLYNETAVNDLSFLPYICPNIYKLSIIYCSGIVNLNFIKELSALKILSALETPACTIDILNYLNDNNILSDLNESDVENNKKLVDILNCIITDDMTEDEKVNRICVYIKNNIKTSLLNKNFGRYEPLSSILDECKGISYSYAYLANSLFNMVGVTSVDLNNGIYNWNLIEVNDKYYYVDIYNLCPTFFVDKFNIGFYYMQDPNNVSFSTMDKLDNLDISDNIKNKIEESNSSKNFIEKYLCNWILNLIFVYIVVLCKNNSKNDGKMVKKKFKR